MVALEIDTMVCNVNYLWYPFSNLGMYCAIIQFVDVITIGIRDAIYAGLYPHSLHVFP